jgi:hypothetical protein
LNHVDQVSWISEACKNVQSFIFERFADFSCRYLRLYFQIWNGHSSKLYHPVIQIHKHFNASALCRAQIIIMERHDILLFQDKSSLPSTVGVIWNHLFLITNKYSWFFHFISYYSNRNGMFFVVLNYSKGDSMLSCFWEGIFADNESPIPF